MDPFDELLIKKYMALEKEIYRLVKYKTELKETFYAQNMATHLVYSDLGVHSEGFRQDIKVIDYLMILEMVDERINRYLLRKKYFDDFLNTLSIREIKFLKFKSLNEVPTELIEKAINEIEEIEIAINYRCGIEIDDLDVVNANDMNENVERMCDFFAL